MLTLERKFPVGLHKFVNDMKQEYTMEIVYSKCKPTFYHQYALSKLKENNYNLAVCSNSIRNSVHIMMEKSGLLNYLDFFISNEDVAKGKPDPEMYIKAIKKMGHHPEECLIVEDNENGIKAALASGAHLLKVEQVSDVNYFNIMNRIKEIENYA
jgi:HAD superfamily hydrolase (TIGR01549 family)